MVSIMEDKEYEELFDSLLNNPIILKALKKSFIDKFMQEDYVDVNMYINPLFNKNVWFSELRREESDFSDLYKIKQLDLNKIVVFFKQKVSNFTNAELTSLEAEGLTSLIFKSISKERRLEFSKQALKHIQKKIAINQSKNVFYNSDKVKLEFITTINGLNKILDSDNCAYKKAFYRGQASANYLLKPSIYRSKEIKENEYNLYNEALKECPDDFYQCERHIEKLVKMQHYGLPTRLLDITKSPLVALYFACKDNMKQYGELVVLCSPDEKMKYPQSDNVSILASLPFFSYEEQMKFLYAVSNFEKEKYKEALDRLIHAVQFEKPAFINDIKRDTILDNFFVLALKSNRRIVSQDGAFIICGLENNKYSINDYRLKDDEGKKIIILIDNKEKILSELDFYYINQAKLFPELETVSQYLKDRYK